MLNICLQNSVHVTAKLTALTQRYFQDIYFILVGKFIIVF